MNKRIAKKIWKANQTDRYFRYTDRQRLKAFLRLRWLRHIRRALRLVRSIVQYATGDVP